MFAYFYAPRGHLRTLRRIQFGIKCKLSKHVIFVLHINLPMQDVSCPRIDFDDKILQHEAQFSKGSDKKLLQQYDNDHEGTSTFRRSDRVTMIYSALENLIDLDDLVSSEA